MPDNHEIVKAEAWAPAALGLLHRDIVLAGLVQRDTGANFIGAANDTVNIRRPSRLAAVNEALREMQESGYAIESESLNETSIAVQLNRHVYSAVDLTDAQLTLDIADFGAQVLTPQSRAVATRLEFMVASAMNDLSATEVEGSGFTAVRRAIIALRRQLNANDVPADGRILAIGVDVEEQLLRDPHLTQVDQSGSDSALRNAEVARLYGFRIVVSNTLDSDRMVAFHPSAWTLVTRAPVVPASVNEGRSESYEGFSLRAIRDYNSRVAQDRSLISTFAGVGETTDQTVSYSSTGSPSISEDFTMVRAVAATVDTDGDNGNGDDGGTQDVRIVGTDTAVPVNVTGTPEVTVSGTTDVAITGQPIEVDTGSGDAAGASTLSASSSASGTRSAASKPAKPKPSAKDSDSK